MSVKYKELNSDDWRKQGQDRYLKGVNIVFRDYYPYRQDWDHDHCEFCGAKFSKHKGDLNKGFSTMDSYHWICLQCYNDFKDEFKWVVEKSD